MESAILLRNKYGLTAEEVERIDIKTYSLAVAGHDHTDIPGSYSAKMSIPYSTAAGLIYGRAGLQEFSEEKVKNSSILELTKKVHVVSDKELSDVFPGIQAAIVEITTKNGIISKRVDFPKGEPENPLSDEEFRLRYDELMDYANMDRAASGVAFDAVYQEEMTVRNLLKLFEQAGGL